MRAQRAWGCGWEPPPAPPGASVTATDESTCTPDSVPAGWRGWRPSISACRCRQALAAYPQARAGSPRTPAQAATSRRGLLGLAPGGVYRATPVTRGAGGLLPHRFTLTRPEGRAVCSLWHCPAGHPGLPLTTTLPCGARTFLGGTGEGADATARPTRPSLHDYGRPATMNLVRHRAPVGCRARRRRRSTRSPAAGR